MQTGKFNTIVDSAWGSSGKGAASTRLADIHGVKHLSSGNYPNAGHTVVFGDKKFIFKVVPSGAALRATKNSDINIYIGPGSGFDVTKLFEEIEETKHTLFLNAMIHERATSVTAEHVAAESPTGSQSTLTISSTMSGSGAAFTSKAMRQPNVVLAKDIRIKDPNNLTESSDTNAITDSFPVPIGTTAWEFYERIQNVLGKNAILHEVSQGYALSINHGTHYPHCTFRDCVPQQAYSDFGITPDQVGDVYLNVRSLPIRVGNNFDKEGNLVGYSGNCMPDQHELTWDEIAASAEFPKEEALKLAENERTTVTKKIRRVFTPSWELLRRSAKFCGATKLILNFPQYIHWSSHGVRGGKDSFNKLHKSVREYVDMMESVTSLPVVMIGTGADHDDYIYLD